MKTKLFKGILTVIGAISFTTLGIFAADSLQGIDSEATVANGQVCAAGTQPFKNGEIVSCVDVYEASPSSDCPYAEPGNILESEQNTNATNCYAASVSDATPWRFVSLPQAQRLCAGAGKRLPTSEEWYKIALGTDVLQCNTNSGGVSKTGDFERCVSSVGAYDVIGNSWEWVDATIVGASYNGRDLPAEGYVSEVDGAGVATVTTEGPRELYGEDYFWSKADGGVYGMIRGGFYGSDTDAGLYTVNAAVQTSFAAPGVGFRCVKDVL